MKKDEKIQENNARHAGETHNNNSLPFSAVGLTCTGMNFFWVTFANVSFTIEKVTLLDRARPGPAARLGQIAVVMYVSLYQLAFDPSSVQLRISGSQGKGKDGKGKSKGKSKGKGKFTSRKGKGKSKGKGFPLLNTTILAQAISMGVSGLTFWPISNGRATGMESAVRGRW